CRVFEGQFREVFGNLTVWGGVFGEEAQSGISRMRQPAEGTPIFDPKCPITLYYVCAVLMKKIEVYLKSDSAQFTQKDRTHLRFYVGMFVASEVTKKAEPLPADIASLSIEDVKEEVLSEALAHIRPIYETLGASDEVAKGS